MSMIMKSVVVKALESERLIYQPMAMHHATPTYLGWLNDEEVNKYLEVKKENTLEELQVYVQDALEKKIFFWAIQLKSDGKHIGNIKIDPINYKHGTGEYGIMVGDKTEWGKGYAKEASQAIIDFCFNEMNLRKITLGVVEDNVAAVELYKKLGFTIEGTYKKHALYNGVYCNIIRMALFNPAYKY
ncbi:MAG: N-acetyltransferase [Chitinophagaceae bacterium]|nr:MAG: N-acetyltransferase [Chitinophagaceae bacterium]